MSGNCASGRVPVNCRPGLFSREPESSSGIFEAPGASRDGSRLILPDTVPAPSRHSIAAANTNIAITVVLRLFFFNLPSPIQSRNVFHSGCSSNPGHGLKDPGSGLQFAAVIVITAIRCWFYLLPYATYSLLSGQSARSPLYRCPYGVRLRCRPCICRARPPLQNI